MENQAILEDPTFVSGITRTSSSSSASSSSSPSSQSNGVSESTTTYSLDDIRTIEEMFPNIDRQIIVNLLEKHGGNKDLAVNELLQTNAS